MYSLKSKIVGKNLRKLRAASCRCYCDFMPSTTVRLIRKNGEESNPNLKVEKSDFPKKTEKERSPEFRVNDVNIQMISKNLYEQLFKEPCHSLDTNIVKRCQQDLKRHGIDYESSDHLPDVELKLPKLEGKDVVEHFYNIGEQQAAPYRELLVKLAGCQLPPLPKKWSKKSGWHKYTTTAPPQPVPCPDDDALILDVEVLMSAGKRPTLACAVSPDAWYGWVSKPLANGEPHKHHSDLTYDSLIPLETDGSELVGDVARPRVVVGHNVAYDRGLVKEQYWLEKTGVRFMDTMSMHTCVSGVTSYQRAMLKSKEKGNASEEDWMDISSLNSLTEVHKLYCGSAIDKQTRDTFVNGTMEEVNANFQGLMNYCAGDVEATARVLKCLLPMFLERFPHPVTLAGMLELGSTYLPINSNWNQYIDSAETVFEDCKLETRQLLSLKADEACRLMINEEYKNDLWMFDEDWSTQTLKLKKSGKKDSVVDTDFLFQEDTSVEKDYDVLCEDYIKQVGKIKDHDLPKPSQLSSLTNKFEYLYSLSSLLPVRRPQLPGYPAWYRKLCAKIPSGKEEAEAEWAPGANNITTSMQITPKLLRLTWEGYPLHHSPTEKWGFLVPFAHTRPVTYERGPEPQIPLKELVEKCPVVKCEGEGGEYSERTMERLSKSVEEDMGRRTYYARKKLDEKASENKYHGLGVWCGIQMQDTFTDAENWIRQAETNHNGTVASESDKIDSHLKTRFNRKIRKKTENHRERLPNISLKRSGLFPNQTNKKLFQIDVSKSTAVNDATRRPGCSKDKQFVIIKDDVLIQGTKMKTATSKGKTEKSIQLEGTDQSDKSRQSTSPKQCLHTQNYKQPVLTIIDDDDVIDVDEEVQPEPVSNEIPSKTPEPPKPVNKEPASEVNKMLVQEQRPPQAPAGQSKEADSQKTQLHMILTTPTVQRGRANQPQQLPPSPSSTFVSNPEQQGTDDGRSTEVTLNFQRPRSHGFLDESSASHYEPNSVYDSAKSLTPARRKRSQSVIQIPVDKTARLENIAESISINPPRSITQRGISGDFSAVQAQLPAQTHLEEPVGNGRSNIEGNAYVSYHRQYLQGSMAPTSAASAVPASSATSAAQNLSNIAYRSRSFVEPSHEPRHILTYEDYSRHIARMSYVCGSSYVEQTTDPRIYSQNSMKQVLTYEHQERRTNPKPYPQNLTFTAPNASQPHHHLEHPEQRQHFTNLQDPRINLSFGPQSRQRPIPQEITYTPSPAMPKLINMVTQPLPDTKQYYLAQAPHVQAIPKQNPGEHHNVNISVITESIPDEPVPVMKNSEVQTTPPYEHETQSVVVPGNIYKNPQTKKMVVDQATEMNDMNVDYYEDGITHLPAVDNACQTDEYLTEEQTSSDQDSSDTDQEMVSDNEDSLDSSTEANTDTRPTVINPTPENHLAQARLVAEQDILTVFGTLFTQMGTNLSHTRSMIDQIQNSILVCADIYENLLQKIDIFNQLENLQIPTSSPNSTTSQAPQVSNRIPTGNPGNVQPVTNVQRHSFVLPPEYDANDSRWTLQHRQIKPGLKELMPRSRIFVNAARLKKCLRESRNCRSLARMLLTEVFSKNALSVCSLTGRKAAAFNSVKVDVRPGLDEHARMVLLTFVEIYGNKQGWKTTNTSAIFSSIRSKIQEMRSKYGRSILT